MLTLPHRDEFRGYCPNSEQIDEYWSIAAPLLQKALDRGSDYTLDDIYAGLKSTEMQLWMWSDEMALVTKLENKDERRWCLLLALGGDNMENWIYHLPLVEDWARDKGCDEMRIYGRAGWSRKIGYHIGWSMMSRKL